MKVPKVAAAFAITMVVGCHAVAPTGEPSLGPLALARGENGDAALTTGVLRLTNDCAILEYRTGQRITLIWPAARTKWNVASNAVIHRNTDGTVFTLLDGDQVSFGGSGTTGDVLKRMNWVQPPDPRCPSTEAWFLNDVVVPRDES